MTEKEKERYKEFIQRCVKEKGKLKKMDGSADRKREATRFKNLSDYHFEAVKDSLEGRAPLMA